MPTAQAMGRPVTEEEVPAQPRRPSVTEEEAKASVVVLLRYLGEHPGRDGLKDTPRRVVKALTEMTLGYDDEPKQILQTTFDVPYDEMVLLKDIDFVSLCEHHLLPFRGVAHVGYVPGERVVGLSKMARLVQCYARRLQVQERLTDQIAQAMMKHLDPKGVGVVIEAHHHCMSCRGVKQSSASMITSSMQGVMREPSPRSEFMALAGVT